MSRAKSAVAHNAKRSTVCLNKQSNALPKIPVWIQRSVYFLGEGNLENTGKSKLNKLCYYKTRLHKHIVAVMRRVIILATKTYLFYSLKSFSC